MPASKPPVTGPRFEPLEGRVLLSTGPVSDAGQVLPAGNGVYTSTHSFSNTANGTHPFTVTGSSSQITVDLSSLPAGTQVYRAVLRHNRYGNTGYYQQAAGATSPLEVQAHDASGVWLEPLAPRYHDFDCTAAAQRAMLLPGRRLVIDMISFPGFDPAAGVRVDVWCDAPAVNAIAPVTDITIKHRDGDTMVTFNEVVDYLTIPNATADQYNAAKANANAGGITYRIYRSEVPLDATTIRQAELVDEIAPLSNWNLGFYNGYYSGSSIVPRLPVDDEVLSGVDEGIYVRRCAGADPDGAYYAVSTALWGEEDLSAWTAGENAAASAIVEDTGPGMVLLRTKVLDTDWFYESRVDRYYYDRWECPPTYSFPSTPMDYLVGLPNDSVSPRPVDIALHCWGGNIEGGYGWWYEADRGALFLATNQVPYDWWTASHDNYLTVKPFLPVEGNDGGVVRNYEQERILSFLDDFVATHYSVDLDHVLVSGSSMGGAGAIMWGARGADRFAYANGWVGVYTPRLSPQFKGSFEIVYGQDAWNCQYLDTGMSAFDYWDSARFVRSDPGQEVPYLCFANGKNDDSIGWWQAWDFVQALTEARQPFKFYWSQGGHGTRSQLPAGNDRVIGIDIDGDATLPAFTHCSLDNNLGDGSPTNGDAEGHVNRWNLWRPETSVDLPDRWEMTIYLQSSASSASASVDVTPRRTQAFDPAPGTKVFWTNTSVASGKVVQSGMATVDEYGLVTIESATISKTNNRLVLIAGGLPIMGDANLDGKVDGADYSIWADHYCQTGLAAWADGGWQFGNFSGDGVVDGADYTLWADHYGDVAGDSAGAPAPTDAQAAAGEERLSRALRPAAAAPASPKPVAVEKASIPAASPDAGADRTDLLGESAGRRASQDGATPAAARDLPPVGSRSEARRATRAGLAGLRGALSDWVDLLPGISGTKVSRTS